VTRLYQFAFIVGVAATAIGIGLGVYQSFATGEGPPPVYINYVGEIQKLLVDGEDYESAIDALRLAARIDYFGKRPRHWFEIAKASYRIQDLDSHQQAIKALRALSQSGSTADQRIYYYLAVAIMLQPSVGEDEMTEALGLASQAVSVEPDYGPAHLTFGQALAVMATSESGRVNLSELQMAEFHLKRAVSLEPSNVEAVRALDNLRKLLATLRDQPSS